MADHFKCSIYSKLKPFREVPNVQRYARNQVLWGKNVAFPEKASSQLR